MVSRHYICSLLKSGWSFSSEKGHSMRLTHHEKHPTQCCKYHTHISSFPRFVHDHGYQALVIWLKAIHIPTIKLYAVESVVAWSVFCSYSVGCSVVRVLIFVSPHHTGSFMNQPNSPGPSRLALGAAARFARTLAIQARV